jgi:hypothetical protein
MQGNRVTIQQQESGQSVKKLQRGKKLTHRLGTAAVLNRFVSNTNRRSSGLKTG